MCVCAFVRGGVTPIIANRCAFVFNAPKKSSPSSALPLLFLRCARDDEIDGRSVYPSRWEHHCCTELTQFPVPLILFFLFGLCSVFRTKHTHGRNFIYLFFFFCFSNSFFCFGHWPLLFVAWTTLVLHCVAMVPESTNTQQARFCSFFKKLLFRWENSTFGCCYHRICGIKFFLKLSPAVCGRKIERCSIEKVFVYLRFWFQ